LSAVLCNVIVPTNPELADSRQLNLKLDEVDDLLETADGRLPWWMSGSMSHLT
jgi:hypothetical protein